MNAVVYDFCRRLAEADGDERTLELLAAGARVAAILEEFEAINDQVSELARENDERGPAADDPRLRAAWHRIHALEAEFVAIDRRLRELALEGAAMNPPPIRGVARRPEPPTPTRAIWPVEAKPPDPRPG